MKRVALSLGLMLAAAVVLWTFLRPSWLQYLKPLVLPIPAGSTVRTGPRGLQVLPPPGSGLPRPTPVYVPPEGHVDVEGDQVKVTRAGFCSVFLAGGSQSILDLSVQEPALGFKFFYVGPWGVDLTAYKTALGFNIDRRIEHHLFENVILSAGPAVPYGSLGGILSGDFPVEFRFNVVGALGR